MSQCLRGLGVQRVGAQRAHVLPPDVRVRLAAAAAATLQRRLQLDGLAAVAQRTRWLAGAQLLEYQQGQQQRMRPRPVVPAQEGPVAAPQGGGFVGSHPDRGAQHPGQPDGLALPRGVRQRRLLVGPLQALGDRLERLALAELGVQHDGNAQRVHHREGRHAAFIELQHPQH